MDSRQIREAIKSAYDSKSWKEKVDRMSDSQVYAIYRRLLNTGRIK